MQNAHHEAGTQALLGDAQATAEALMPERGRRVAGGSEAGCTKRVPSCRRGQAKTEAGQGHLPGLASRLFESAESKQES